MSQEGLSALDMLISGRTPAGKAGSASPESLKAHSMSIIVISPDEERRREITSGMNGLPPQNVKEYENYPEGDFLENLIRDDHDVFMIDLDGNPAHALYLVETICARSSSTVMVFSGATDSDLLVQCMRAGAREFLKLPVEQPALEIAIARAYARRPTDRPVRTNVGNLYVFSSVKGGSGATTIACNFAVVLAQTASANGQRCRRERRGWPVRAANTARAASSLVGAERLDEVAAGAPPRAGMTPRAARSIAMH